MTKQIIREGAFAHKAKHPKARTRIVEVSKRKSIFKSMMLTAIAESGLHKDCIDYRAMAKP